MKQLRLQHRKHPTVIAQAKQLLINIFQFAFALIHWIFWFTLYPAEVIFKQVAALEPNATAAEKREIASFAIPKPRHWYKSF